MMYPGIVTITPARHECFVGCIDLDDSLHVFAADLIGTERVIDQFRGHHATSTHSGIIRPETPRYLVTYQTFHTQSGAIDAAQVRLERGDQWDARVVEAHAAGAGVNL